MMQRARAAENFGRPAAARLRSARPAARSALAVTGAALLLGAAFSAGLLASTLLARPAPAPAIAAASGAATTDAITLRVISATVGTAWFERHERAFWTTRLAEVSGGRFRVELNSFESSGLVSGASLPLLALGVVTVVTVPVAQAADAPELAAPALPLLHDDIAGLRAAVAAWRPAVAALLTERYDAELLAVQASPALLLFCRPELAGLGDLAGRRVRAPGAAEAELLLALDAQPLLLPLADSAAALRDGVADCAIASADAALEVGLHQHATHLLATPIGWKVMLAAAPRAALSALPPVLAATLRGEVATLEQRLWDDAERATREGPLCLADDPSCPPGAERARLTLAAPPAGEAALRARLLAEVVLPAWVHRCATDCAAQWDRLLAPVLGLPFRAE